jgi:hypothetical protein
VEDRRVYSLGGGIVTEDMCSGIVIDVTLMRAMLVAMS